MGRWQGHRSRAEERFKVSPSYSELILEFNDTVAIEALVLVDDGRSDDG